MENVKEINLSDAFSKGFINDRADIKNNYQYASILENGRIFNKTTFVRKGYELLSDVGTPDVNKYITGLGVYKNKLVVTYGNNIFLSNSDLTLFTNIGTLNTGVNTKKSGPSITTYGDYLMIFNGGVPQVYDGTTLSNISTIDAGYLPNISVINDNRQWISNGTPTIILSTPSTSTTPTDIYKFNNVAESPIKTFTSNVVSIKNILKANYIFTEDEIHQFSGAYASTSPAAPILEKIYDGTSPRNNNCVVSANNTIFFLSKDNKIKTINYVPGIPNSVVGELSSREGNSIEEYISNNFHENQEGASGRYSELENIIFFNFRSINSTGNNDKVIGYDLKNLTWILDTNKNYSTKGININSKYIVGSSIDNKIFIDNKGNKDNGNNIIFKRRNSILSFGNPSIRKTLREIKLSGNINLTSNIEINIYVDGELNKSFYIDKSIVSNDIVGLKSDNILYRFRKVLSRGELFEKGYVFEIEFISEGNELMFNLENLTVSVSGLSDSETNELFEK